MNAKQRIAKLPSQKEQQLLEKVRQSLEMKELNKNDLVTPGTSSDIRSVVSRSDSELKLTRSTKSNEENIRTLDGRKPLLRRQFESGGPAEERGKVSDTGDQGVARKEKSLHTMSDEKKRPNKQSIEEKVSKHVSIHDLLQPLPVQSIKTNVTFPASTLVFAKENAPKDTTKSEVSNKSSNNVESASFIKTESTATPFIDDKLTSVPMIKTVSEASSIKPESVEATMLKDESKTLHCSLDTATIVQAKEPIEMAEQDARTLIPAKNVEQHLTKLDEEDAKATEEVLITSYEVANLSQPTKPMKDSFLMPKTSTDLKLSQDQKLSPESPIEQKIVLELAHKSGKESNSIEKHSLMFEDDLNLQREQEMLIRKPKRVTASTTSDTSISKSESDFRETKRRRKRKNKDQRDMSVKKEQEIRKKKIDVQNKLQQSIHTSYDQSETTSDVDESNAKKKKMLVKMEKDIEDLFKVKGKDIMEEQPKSNDIVSDQSDFEARDGKSPSWEQLSNIDKSPIRTESVITSPTPEPNEMQIEGSVLYSNDNRQFFQSEAQFRLPEKFQNKPFKVVIDSPAPRKMWKKANSMTK